MIYVLFNPKADNRNGEANAKKLNGILTDEEMSFMDITELNIREFLAGVSPEDRVIVSGGDGTIHYLVNQLEGKVPEHRIYYYPAGSGNDFKTDISEQISEDLILLDPYIENLPTVTINGKDIRFLNGIGFGIDGYCCEEGDRLRSLSDKPINYAAIAVKGMLFHFKPRSAVVTVDGEKHTYDHVWIAPTMNGRFYGGGMQVAPQQNRLNSEGLVTAVIMHCPSKLKTLTVFPTIFKGKHVEHTKMVEVLTGHDITVTFDRPTPLQVDGETYTGVLEYTVSSAKSRESSLSETQMSGV